MSMSSKLFAPILIMMLIILTFSREKPVEALSSIHLESLAFQPEWGPSFDGITVKNNFVEIKGKRSFDSR